MPGVCPCCRKIEPSNKPNRKWRKLREYTYTVPDARDWLSADAKGQALVDYFEYDLMKKFGLPTRHMSIQITVQPKRYAPLKEDPEIEFLDQQITIVMYGIPAAVALKQYASSKGSLPLTKVLGQLSRIWVVDVQVTRLDERGHSIATNGVISHIGRV